MASGTVNINLIQPKFMESTQTTQYTAIGVAAIIDKFTVTNESQNNEQFRVNLVTPGNVPGASNLIVKEATVEPGKTDLTPELIGHSLEQGASISTLASTNSTLVVMCSGREIR